MGAPTETWICDALVTERVVTFTEVETIASLDDLMELYDALEHRRAMRPEPDVKS